MHNASITIEAILFYLGKPVEKDYLLTFLELSKEEIDAAIKDTADRLSGHGITLVETETTVELRTSTEVTDVINKIRKDELSNDLGRSCLETLAVIAYRDGTSHEEINWVRGVNSSASIRTLLLRGLIEEKEDTDHKQVRYFITTEALGHLGVSRTDDLPNSLNIKPSIEMIFKKIKSEESFS